MRAMRAKEFFAAGGSHRSFFRPLYETRGQHLCLQAAFLAETFGHLERSRDECPARVEPNVADGPNLISTQASYADAVVAEQERLERWGLVLLPPVGRTLHLRVYKVPKVGVQRPRREFF